MPHNTIPSFVSGPITHNGVYYFPTTKSADNWCAEPRNSQWAKYRYVYYDRGIAIQAGPSGNYAGPGEEPRPWTGYKAVSHE